MIFDRLANGIQRHSKAIIVVWVVILCLSGYFAMRSGEVMSYDMNEMAPDDSESIKGIAIMQEYFPSSEADVNSTPILILYYEDADGLEDAQSFLAVLNSKAKSTEHIDSFMSMDPTSPTGPGIVMAMVVLKDVENATSFTPDIREFLKTVKESEGYDGGVYLTGMTAIAYDMEHNALEDISKIDPFTVLMILILVGLFFRSFVSSATPPLTIGVAFAVTMGLIFFIGQVLNIFFITNMIILVSMMGAGCDYCIFIIARYREELRKGHTHDESVHEAIVWAGESITISGASVIIGFGAISICDYSLISTMGICLALGILIALLAALTLIPSILQLVGDRIFWPTRIDAYKEGGKATKGWYAWCAKVGNSYFHKSAKFSLKHAKAIAIVAVLVTAPAVYVMHESEDSYDMISSMLSGDSGQGMEYIGEYADQGMVMPNYSLIEYNGAIANIVKVDSGYNNLYWTDYWNGQVKPTLTRLYEKMSADDNVAYATGPFVWNDIKKEMDEAGITDTDAQVAFIKTKVSSMDAMYFEGLITQTSAQGLQTKYVINGPGAFIDDMFNVEFDWDKEVAASKAKGLTDSDAIIADMANHVYPTPLTKMLLPSIVSALNAQGLTNDMLVYGMGPIIDQAVQSAVPGIEYSWDAAVQSAKSTGLVGPDEIVEYVLTNAPEGLDQVLYGVTQNLHQQGITNEILAYGFGPMVNMAFDQAVPDFKWDDLVSQAKLVTSDPDEIVALIVNGFQQQYPQYASVLTMLLNAMYGMGITNAYLVDGLGTAIDYVMNVMTSNIGGQFVLSGSGEASYIKITTATEAAAMSPRSMESISLIEDAVKDYKASHSSIVVEKWDTGTAVIMYEVSETVKQQFNFIEIIVVILILILLFVVMRSYTIPFRSVLTILMSITWTLAATHIVFVDMLGIDIIWLIPILLLVICLGLGMDYDILLTTRIKENVMARGMSNDDAIYHAVTHTGSVITICGLIMGGAFGTLMISGMPMLQEFGFALCFAILVDALIVRTYIVPAVMHILGDWNWKGPGYKKRMAKLQGKEQ